MPVRWKKGIFPLMDYPGNFPMTAKDNSINQLVTYRHKLSVMQAIKCGLKHEEVKSDRIGQPLKLGHPDVTSYERIGFCNQKLRQFNLTCAHTQSRYVIREALAVLKQADPSSYSNYVALESHLNDMESTIHQLDIQKGEKEKALAVLTDDDIPSNTLLLTNIRSGIEKITARHNAVVEAVNMLKKEVIKNIDRTLMTSQKV